MSSECGSLEQMRSETARACARGDTLDAGVQALNAVLQAQLAMVDGGRES